MAMFSGMDITEVRLVIGIYLYLVSSLLNNFLFL